MTPTELEKIYKEASRSPSCPRYMITNLDNFKLICEKLGLDFEKTKKLSNVLITGDIVEIFSRKN